jgi:hypothetical protein
MKFSDWTDDLASPPLDIKGFNPYSFTFRTHSLSPVVQRFEGSVGVDALPGCFSMKAVA